MTSARRSESNGFVDKEVRTQRRLPAEEGVWVFLFGDMTVFAMLFGVYLYYRGQTPGVFDESQPG